MSNQPTERPHIHAHLYPNNKALYQLWAHCHYSYAPCALSNIYDVHFGECISALVCVCVCVCGCLCVVITIICL